jgi:chromosome partitioning protein
MRAMPAAIHHERSERGRLLDHRVGAPQKSPAEEAMRVDAQTVRTEEPRSAHVVVLGNEKGGSGKSTTAMHVAVALMKAGQRVATIDLDSRQGSFSNYIGHRRAWAQRAKLELELPVHFRVARGEGPRVDENEATEFAGFADAVTSVEHTHDFVVIDTPGTDSYLTRLAHSMADTLITPVNDSFVDFDVLGTIDPETFALTGTSHYSEMVREARRQRRIVDGRQTDWIVVRNRLSALGSRNKRLVGEGLAQLAAELGFRFVEGLAERVVYREFFPRGLTALDTIDETTLGMRPSMAHVTARQEVQGLLAALRLPIDERWRHRVARRDEWFANADAPLDTGDILAD